MSRGKVWVFDPDSGGKKIPDSVKNDVERRINDIAQQHFKGKYIRLEIRFKPTFRTFPSCSIPLLRFPAN